MLSAVLDFDLWGPLSENFGAPQPAQQWLLETVGIEPAAEGEASASGTFRSQDARWAANLTAARQFHAREGHLTVPRQYVEITGDGDGDSGRAAVKLGAWLDNTRRRLCGARKIWRELTARVSGWPAAPSNASCDGGKGGAAPGVLKEGERGLT
jgi:hypothetical protein